MEIEAMLISMLSENVLLHVTPKSNIEYLVQSQEDVWTRKDIYTIVGIGLSFFVLFFKVWWDDKEKKNQ